MPVLHHSYLFCFTMRKSCLFKKKKSTFTGWLATDSTQWRESLLSDWGPTSRQRLTVDDINLISPWSALTIWFTSCRLSIFVKRLRCCSTGRTPAAILNCKHAVTRSHCSHGTLCNGVLSRAVWSIQNRILSFQGLNCSTWFVQVASDGC